MNTEEKLTADIKSAMLARDSEKTETLKGLKSALLYEKVASGKRDEGLSEEEVLTVFKREAKKRKDAIELYKQGGNEASAQKEQTELTLIEQYLPEMMSEEETEKLITKVMSDLGIESPQRSDTGRIIGAVKKEAGASADPATIAKIVSSKVSQ